MYPPGNEKLVFQVKVTCWLWLMYTPTLTWEMKRLDLGWRWHVASGWCTSPHPWIGKLEWGSEWPKCKKPPKSLKVKCSFLDYVQLLMIGQAIQVMKVDQNAKKPPTSLKVKCSFLDYIQLLMFSWATQAMKVDKNVPPKCLRMTRNSQFHPIHNFSNLFHWRH